MDQIDFMYYKLSLKYGIGNIAMMKEIRSNYTLNNDGSYNKDKDTLGGIYFIKLSNKHKINIEQEKAEGTFNV